MIRDCFKTRLARHSETQKLRITSDPASSFQPERTNHRFCAPDPTRISRFPGAIRQRTYQEAMLSPSFAIYIQNLGSALTGPVLSKQSSSLKRGNVYCGDGHMQDDSCRPVDGEVVRPINPNGSHRDHVVLAPPKEVEITPEIQ